MIAVFVGSFDPFTIGHQSVVDRALKLVDRLVIGVGVNPEKKYMFSTEERVSRIRDIYNKEKKVEVEAYSGMTIDFAKSHHADCIIKGLRNAEDFTYELPQADYNREHGGLETLFIPATPETREISSTKVRTELLNIVHKGTKVTKKEI